MGETSMSDKTLEQRVIAVVADQLGVPEADVKTSHNLVDDLGADSLDSVELVMAIEQEFEIDIPDEIAEKLLTVQEIIDKVKAEKPDLVWPKKEVIKSPRESGAFFFLNLIYSNYY